MRVILIILFIGVSLIGYSRRGISLRDYYLFYGQTFTWENKFQHSFEIQYDNKFESCLFRTKYKGIGVSILTGEKEQNFGFKGMYNPTRIKFTISRRLIIYPYLLAQINLVRENKSFDNYKNNLSPGIGLNGVWRITRKINIRLQCQVRYNVNQEYLKNRDGIRIKSFSFFKKKYEN